MIPRLRWTKSRHLPDYWEAWLGEHRFGTVGQREDGSVFYTADGAIRGRGLFAGIAGGPYPKSVAHARRSVNAHWRRWAKRAGLT